MDHAVGTAGAVAPAMNPLTTRLSARLERARVCGQIDLAERLRPVVFVLRHFERLDVDAPDVEARVAVVEDTVVNFCLAQCSPGAISAEMARMAIEFDSVKYRLEIQQQRAAELEKRLGLAKTELKTSHRQLGAQKAVTTRKRRATKGESS
jgi:hypothetical protein